MGLKVTILRHRRADSVGVDDGVLARDKELGAALKAVGLVRRKEASAVSRVVSSPLRKEPGVVSKAVG